MRIEARVYQAALKSYGYDPGALDGVIGPATLEAARRFDDWVESEPGGDTFGDYSIVPAADNRSVEITPDNPAGQRFRYRGTTYLAENPDEAVFPTRRSTRSATPSPEAPPGPPAALALPFFRSGNPWLWLLMGLGFISLGAGAFYVARKMRRR